MALAGFHALPRLHRCQHEVVVVAGVDLQLLEIQVRDVRADLIQEVPIVADDDHRGFVVVEHVFEPADRVDVEVVGGLVEQQHVGPGKQRLRQQHAQLQARRHLAHGAVVQRLIESGVHQDGAGPGLGVVTTVLGVLAFELRGAHVVVVAGLGIGVDAIALGQRLPHFLVTLHHHVKHALVFVTELVLVQLAQAQPGLQHHFACARLQVPAQDLHQRGLATAVGADQAIAVAIGELDRNLLEERFRAELDRQIGRGKHGSAGAKRGRAVYWKSLLASQEKPCKSARNPYTFAPRSLP